MKQNIKGLGILVIGLLTILVFYLSYLNVFRGDVISANPYNRRFQEYEAQVRRGTIYDIQGLVLARTDIANNENIRVYPMGRETAHLLGYVSERYGRTGLESVCDHFLLGREGADRIRNLINKLLDREQLGGDVTLTIDAYLQSLAMDMLENRRGAVVLLDPRTGAVRVMASNPSYDPNKLDELWPQLVGDENSPLLNRAVQGAYPPGSSFKIVTAAGILAARPDYAGKTFDCPGYLDVNGYRLNDTAVHGNVDMEKAIAVSCNTTFAQLGLDQGAQNFVRTVKAFGILQDPGIGIPARPGTMISADEMIPTELASSAIGQGEMLVSPLHMVLVAAAVANKGETMHPYLLETVKDSMGKILQQGSAHHWLYATTPEISGIIREGMVDAVKFGTATAAAVPGFQVAGKTGSAQNPHGQTHAWFIGFVPADQPRLAVAVVLENAGSGGAAAAPAAGRLLSAALNRGY
jgi:peptidoglycan glycosyltransferase